MLLDLCTQRRFSLSIYHLTSLSAVPCVATLDGRDVDGLLSWFVWIVDDRGLGVLIDREKLQCCGFSTSGFFQLVMADLACFNLYLFINFGRFSSFLEI